MSAGIIPIQQTLLAGREMSRITDRELKNLKDGQSLAESLGKGRGAMVFRKVGHTTTAYYRYWKGKKSIFIKMGIYKAPRIKAAGFTLEQLRSKAIAMASTRQQIAPQDLKEYLAQQEAERQQVADEKKRAEEIKACKGTFEDLINTYCNSLYQRGRTSAPQVTKALTKNVITAFPELAKKKASDVTTDDIIKILRAVLERGNTTNYNRIRSYIKTAFKDGMRADSDPRHLSADGKRFSIPFNPMGAIPRHADFERVRKRRLSDDEIRQAWTDITNGQPGGFSPLYGLLIKFCFCLYGNRPKQLSRCLWEDVDFEQWTITFIDRKGKGAEPKTRVMPLTQRAEAILREAQKYSGDNPGPFYIRQKTPIATENLSRFVQLYNNWLEEQAREQNKPLPERWTAKDIRRTATRLFTDCDIGKEKRYLLQSREDGSIESKHYDHDDRIPAKSYTAEIYNDYLGQILTNTVPKKIVNIAQYRQEMNG